MIVEGGDNRQANERHGMKFIQVGVGGFGNCWMQVLKNNPEAEVVGLVDISDQNLAAACEKYDYPASLCHRDLETAIAATGAEAVVSCTPPTRHRQDVETALRAGLDVISEKPMANCLEDCQAMLETAKQTGRLYVVSQNYRYQPATWTMAKLLREGKLGKIGQIKVEFYKGVDFGGGFRHDMEYPVIVDMSIHHFDLMRFITGLDATRVAASSWNPFWSNYTGDCSSTALFDMSNGARLLYNASWCAKGDFCSWNGNWQIECENGTLLLNRDEVSILWTSGLYKVDREEAITLESPPKAGQDYVLDEFIAAVKGGPRPATAVEDNIKSVAMVFATVEAMACGQPVAILQG